MKKLINNRGCALCLAAVVALGNFVSLAEASPVGGDKYDVHRVNAYSSDSFNVQFYGGESAGVIVSGDGDTDLDLYVYDENGNLIVSDTSYSDQCAVTFQPRWTGWFRIVVKNRGSVYNRYEIACV